MRVSKEYERIRSVYRSSRYATSSALEWCDGGESPDFSWSLSCDIFSASSSGVMCINLQALPSLQPWVMKCLHMLAIPKLQNKDNIQFNTNISKTQYVIELYTTVKCMQKNIVLMCHIFYQYCITQSSQYHIGCPLTHVANETMIQSIVNQRWEACNDL